MRYILSSIICLLSWIASNQTIAQEHHNHQDSSTHSEIDSISVNAPSENLIISILTCGPGSELYSSFGHTGVRIINKIYNTDEVYNYGTFNYGDPNFYSNFTLGKLNYYLTKSTYRDFIAEYKYDNRSVREQVLDINTKDADGILKYLENNLKPENRYYAYDFIYDNCATRVRDIFPRAIGMNFVFNDVMGKKEISYRNIINEYLQNLHWARTGINILLGSPVDSNMSNEGSMFLPDFLHSGLSLAKYYGGNIVKSDVILNAGQKPAKDPINQPLLVTIALLGLTVVSKYFKVLNGLQPFIFKTVLFISGLLGVIIAFMWLFTNHQSCNDNFNILWAFPANIVIAFLDPKGKSWSRLYGLLGITLLIVALIVHGLGIQNLPLVEMLPLMLSLFVIYFDMYQKSLVVRTEISEAQA